MRNRHAMPCIHFVQERIAQSKRARAGSLAIVYEPQVARTCILQADIVLSFSDVTFVLFLFRFRLFCFFFVITGRRPPFDYPSICMRRQPHAVMFVCSMDQPGKVANPARRGQLNRQNEDFPVRVRA